MHDIQNLIAKMLRGDRRSLARLISLVENDAPVIIEIMELISSHLRHAFRIGITGLPGAGKSTLIEKLTKFIREDHLTVGIIAVDPSSVVTGGAVLGDRVRMQKHYLDEGVFIRSMATRGCYGGLSKAVENTVKLMDAFGKEIILIETTGVGQTETEIINIADSVVLLLMPGFGDSIQLMKAGLIEIADIIVINKADNEGADVLERQVRDELMYSSRREKSVLLTQANNNVGIKDLYQEVMKHRPNELTSRQS
jgi:LAO/AO transport system kinase